MGGIVKDRQHPQTRFVTGSTMTATAVPMNFLDAIRMVVVQPQATQDSRGAPFQDYALRGGEFFDGDAQSWTWTIEGGPCDRVLPNQTSFDLIGANQENAIFRPKLSGSYRVTMRAQTIDGPFECSWVIDVTGPGVRIEMCYPESTTQDLDLYLMRPTAMPDDAAFQGEPWFANPQDVYSPNLNACCWANCEAMIRMAPGRVDWGTRTLMSVNAMADLKGRNGPR